MLNNKSNALVNNFSNDESSNNMNASYNNYNSKKAPPINNLMIQSQKIIKPSKLYFYFKLK